MTITTRRLAKDGCTYVVTFDDYGVVDTITRAKGEGFPVLLASTHRDARAILRAADAVLAGIKAPAGFTWRR
jgi:hypothetical protein